MLKLYSRDEWAIRLMVPLYEERYTQTLWNTDDPDKREKGWTLKGGLWSPWFFNMRPVGDSPRLFCDICRAMAEMLLNHENIDLLIGVEMAGVPLVGASAIIALLKKGRGQRFGYTRPLPEKVRKPLEALRLLREIDSNVADYGQKEFVEARMKDGDRVAICDDVATDLGSKLIARLITLWEAERKGINISCDKIFYLLNRGKGNRLKAKDFVNEPEKELHPAELSLDYIIEFDDHLLALEKSMCPEEYEVITTFQKDPKHFQDKDVQKTVLEMAAKTRQS